MKIVTLSIGFQIKIIFVSEMTNTNYCEVVIKFTMGHFNLF